MESNTKIKALRLFSRLRGWFARNAGFIFLFFLINYITKAWSLAEEEKIEVMIGYGFTLFFATILLMALIRFFLRSDLLIRIVKITLIVVCLIPFFVESFVMYNYKALIGIGVVNSILETNFKEAKEFVEMYIGLQEYVLVAIGCAFALAVWKYKPWQKIHLSYHLQSRILAAVLIVCVFYTIRMLTVYTELFYKDLLPVQRAFSATGTAYANMQAYHKLSAQVISKVELTENKSSIKNVVFILGESANRNHMQLYGYYLPNTPFLQELADKKEICVFRDIISPHSTTVAVLSKLFTFCDYESEKPWYEYNNLIDIMNSAGYKTHWLSNQESSGVWGNVAQVYANHSAMHKFTRIRDSVEDEGTLDEELLPLLEAARKDDDTSGKNFYVLHLMGGHGLYYNRYPYIFHKFREKDIKIDVPEKAKEIIAQYDNALYYNDYVVTSIFDKFKDDEAIVIYLPDHAEAVYDEQGVTGHIEENPNRHMIEIPLVIWASEKFKTRYPEKWRSIQSASDRPYMTDDMIHTVLDLVDVKTKDFDESKSLVNVNFDFSRKRIFNELDYDTQIKIGEVLPEK